MSDANFSLYDEEIRDPNAISPFRKFLGIALICVSVIVGAITVLLGATIMAAFFSDFMPVITSSNLPSQAIGIENQIPQDAMIALYALTFAFVMTAIIGVFKIVLRRF